MKLLRTGKSWLLSAAFVLAGTLLLVLGPGAQDKAWATPPLQMCGGTSYNESTHGCCTVEGGHQVYHLENQCCGCDRVYDQPCAE